MKRKIFKNIIALSAISLSFNALLANQLVLEGSDLLAPLIEKDLKEMATRENVALKINMLGSFNAMDNIRAGKADVAIVGLPKGSKLPDGMTAYPIAYQASIVVVNVVNPIEEITTDKLRAIYAKTESAARLESWEQLGVKNASNMRSILPITTSFGDNVVVELFKYSVMRGSNLAPWVSVVDKKNDVFSLIKANNSAIAIIGKVPSVEQGAVKVIAVEESRSGGEKAYAFKADRDTLYNNDYIMSLPFYIVFKKENAAKVKPLVRILLDDQIARSIDASDFYAVAKNFRKKSLLELDISE